MSFLSFCLPFDSTPTRSKREKEPVHGISTTTTFPGEFIDSFTHTGDSKTGTYITPPDASMLHVQLWGAGGGGGGCETITNPNIYAVGAGGGGGGFAEAYLFPPLQEKYDYFVAQGGEGGEGKTGQAADASWFGIVEDVHLVLATGGQGGASTTGSYPSNFIAMGGVGGVGDGSQANLKTQGSAGGNSLCLFSSWFYVIAGEGGAAPYLSGFTQQRNERYTGPTQVSGITGCSYGGGGSGSFIIQGTNTQVRGGDGAPGCIHITSYT